MQNDYEKEPQLTPEDNALPSDVVEQDAQHDTGDESAPPMPDTYDADKREERFIRHIDRVEAKEKERARKQGRPPRPIDYDKERERFEHTLTKRERKANRRKERERFDNRVIETQEIKLPAKMKVKPGDVEMMRDSWRMGVKLTWADLYEDRKPVSKAEHKRLQQEQAEQAFNEYCDRNYMKRPYRERMLEALRQHDFAREIAASEHAEARSRPTTRRAKGRTGILPHDHVGRAVPGGAAITNEPLGEVTLTEAIERYNQQARPELRYVPKKHRTRRRYRLSVMVDGALPAGMFESLYRTPELHRDLYAAFEVGKGASHALLLRLIKVIGKPSATREAQSAAVLAIVQYWAKSKRLSPFQVDNMKDAEWMRLVLRYMEERPNDRHTKALADASGSHIRQTILPNLRTDFGSMKNLFASNSKSLAKSAPPKEAA
jgi:hypothetical protein